MNTWVVFLHRQSLYDNTHIVTVRQYVVQADSLPDALRKAVLLDAGCMGHLIRAEVIKSTT